MPTLTAHQLDWSQLLCTTRQRELTGGAPSTSPNDDARSAFERDYDRALFATPVRRLQDKAQVFPLEPNDSVRTRLTHSLEVSSISRQLARRAASALYDRGDLDDPTFVDAITTMAATAGLLHDLGNPPFGHAGEAAMGAWFARMQRTHDRTFTAMPASCQQDLLRFEGNAQTIRLVTRLQLLSDWHGLNLTAGTLAAMGKYIAPSDQASRDHDDHAKSKPGFFTSEHELFTAIRAACGLESCRHPVTYLVEAADDICYSMVDLEDGIKKGVLDWSTLKESVLDLTGNSTLAKSCIEDSESRVKDSPMPLGTTGGAFDEACVQAFRTRIIGETTRGALDAFLEQHSAIMNASYQRELVKDAPTEIAALVKACKRTGKRYVYDAPEVVRREIMGQRVLHELMDLFWDAASAFEPGWLNEETGDVHMTSMPAKVYSMISRNYRTVFERAMRENDLPELYVRLQLVADHVAGMTDTFVCTLHREITNRD
ncbi:MAG: dGTP triphosphohydrolase [Planctomycetota bacterium]